MLEVMPFESLVIVSQNGEVSIVRAVEFHVELRQQIRR
jgi:hypothetical protein